jgi:phosphonate transport system substrate-binding protein
LGSAGNPFVIGLVANPEDSQAVTTGDDLAKQIAERTRQNVVSKTIPSYNQLLESMEAGEVHAAWMPPLTYLYASDRRIATVALLTNHFGVYQYGAQFLANVESNFTPYFDPISGLSSADAATALRQFDGLRPCWVEPLSPSGYVLPAGLLEQNQIISSQAVLAQTHTAVVRALYIKGICDFGATFSISGDPRTSSAVQQDLPDVMNRVLIIWRSDAVIPNIALSLQADLSEGDRQTLTNAFLDLAKSPEGRDLLSRSAGNYQVDEMKTVNDSVYDALRDAAKALDLNLRGAIGK